MCCGVPLAPRTTALTLTLTLALTLTPNLNPNPNPNHQGVGTSFAAPVVSGVVALMLEANASLSWRDVQGILATTSQKTDPSDASWATNSVGLHHSYKYGFGLVDAHAAVTAALSWPGYGEELMVTLESNPNPNPKP